MESPTPPGVPVTIEVPGEVGSTTGTLPQYVWTTAEVKLKRWPDAEAISATLAPDRKVEVIYEDGDWVRVRDVLNFGWAPRASLTATAPASEDGEPAAP